MAQNINKTAKQLQTIEYIKKITLQLEKDNQNRVNNDSFMLSESDSLSVSFNIVFQKSQPAKNTSRSRKYVSPYNQNHLSINKIQNSSKKKANRLISFQNKILQQATFKNQINKKPQKPNNSNPKYYEIPSLMSKLEHPYMDKLKTQARQFYHLQKKQKKQCSPLKRKELWSDFLLRQRKWEAQKQVKQINLKKQYMEKPHIKQDTGPRKPIGFTSEELIKILRRNKAKLQQRLRQITPQVYKSSIDRKQERSRSKNKPIRLSHSMEADFLVKIP